MSVATEPQPSSKTVSEVQSGLKQAGNRVRVSKSLESKQGNNGWKKPQQMRRPASRLSESVHQCNASVHCSCSLDSSCRVSSVNLANFTLRMKQNSSKSVKVVLDGVRGSFSVTTCSAEAVQFDHSEYWKPFDNFDPTSVANFTEKKIRALKANSSTLLSEQKLRAVVENARQMIKVQQEFGHLQAIAGVFVNYKPVNNGFRFVHQLPVKTPKSGTISKELMRRGFCCVGPTVV